MARIELNIVALGDFSAVNSQVKALQLQVEALNKGLAGVGVGSTLTKDLAAAQAAFKATMLSTGQFTAQTVKMASETEKFGQALTSGKLKLSDYFQIITGKAGQATASLAALTAEQVKELMSYPQHWRPTLREAAERGESIKETYEELKGFEGLM